MDLQPIFDIAEICYQKGIGRAIISPGSRNAPLTLAFARHPHISCYSIPDERSAAFIGLGMSLKKKEATVLICTSGSAALNYAPAVAEAFFAQIPLLILTADRPPEWIGQLDGQTVFQKGIFGQHVKKSFNFPSSFEYADSNWHCQRIVNEAINISSEYPKGPTHINLPFREPFYPEKNQNVIFNKDLKIIDSQFIERKIKFNYSILNKYKKVLIVLGQQSKNGQLTKMLSAIATTLNIPVIADVISNGHDFENAIKHQDVFLRNKDYQNDLKPELIITLGLSVISKNLKIFLRQHKPEEHWHIQEAGHVADTFQCLTKIIRTDPVSFLTNLKAQESDIESKTIEFYEQWQQLNEQCHNELKQSLEKQTQFNEFSAFSNLISHLPESIDLHLANSMAVRYANLIGIHQKDIEVFCNRGTSGIDGSNSTAVGSALCSDKTTVLVTGDMAFFYDRNAFWHNHLPKNFKIIVFNNHGGGIFRMIDGPRSQPEYEEFFETKQLLSVENLAKEFGFNYDRCTDNAQLDELLLEFFSESSKVSILEIETGSKTNQKVYSEVMKSISKF